MSDRYGLLRLPMLAEEVGDPRTTAVGDPALDVLADFLKASINYDTKVGWAVIHPGIVKPATEPLPVVHTHTHNPDDLDFRENELPALFVYRVEHPITSAFTQDWDKEVSRIAALWVPPSATYEQATIREPFRNAVAKSIHRSLRRRRNRGWVVPGDTDPKAADYGSLLSSRLGAASLHVLSVKPFPLIVEKSQTPYDAMLATIELTEISSSLYDDNPALDRIEGTVTVGPKVDGETPLTRQAYNFRPSVLSISPSSGPTAGGTVIGISGRQFFHAPDVGPLRVLIGSTPCTAVQFLTETTLAAVTPPGSAGARDVTVVLPSGAAATLSGAFTYA
jgi:hypothetical protein